MSEILKLLNSSGRVNLRVLAQLAATHDRAGFGRFIRQPVLAGASVQAGALAARQPERQRDLSQTFIFQVQPPADPDSEESVSDMLKSAVYPLVKGADAARAPNIFTIGRINQNDLIIPDLAISKRHAILEIRPNGYVIRDCKSTNGTWLNGARVGEQPRALNDGDVVAFARYEFTFLLPDSLYRRLTDT